IVSSGNYGNGDKAPYTLGTNIYYNGTAGKLGIDLNFDYYGTRESEAALTDEKSQMRDYTEISTTSHSGNDLYAGKLILSYPVWKGKVQVGTEETFSRRSDSYTISGAQIPASSSKVREDNYAVFASYGFSLKKAGQFNAGVRYEHVDYSFEDLEGDGSFSRKYDNVFPNVSYSVKAGPVQLALSYSAKTQRPDFSMLSSAVRYNSRYILQSGNSALQPQIVNDANLMANWKWMTFVMNYSRTDRAIATWSERFNNDGVVIVRPVNLEKPIRNLSAYLTASPTVGIWSINYTVGLQHQWLTIDAPDPREESGIRRTDFSDRTMVFAKLFNTLKVKGGWQFEVGGAVYGRGYIKNLLMTNVQFDLTAAVQKAFLKDRSLVVRLEGKDLAGLGRFNVFTDFGSHIIRQTNKMDTQRVVLSLRYRFNTAQSKYKGTGAGKEAAGRMK
ncbi:MAG: outer membrane beta-barrel family protein, partial [Candidatus Cryptobacteroides sp.]